MTSIPVLLVDGHNLLFRACFGTPAQIWSRDSADRRDLTTQFMFLALLRKAVNDELGTWCGANRDAIERANVGERLGGVDPVKLVAWNLHGTP